MYFSPSFLESSSLRFINQNDVFKETVLLSFILFYSFSVLLISTLIFLFPSLHVFEFTMLFLPGFLRWKFRFLQPLRCFVKFFLFSHLLNVALSNILINRLSRTVLVFYKYDKKTQSSQISSHHYLSSLLPHYLPFIFPNIHIIHSYYCLVDSFAAAWIADFQAPLSMEFPK